MESGDPAAVADLSERLQQIDRAIQENDYRTANVRAGYVYVISNRGAFGPNIVKIGLTRRLEPMDRVRELGDASVPFPFDVHAMFFADDAVTVESDCSVRPAMVGMSAAGSAARSRSQRRASPVTGALLRSERRRVRPAAISSVSTARSRR